MAVLMSGGGGEASLYEQNFSVSSWEEIIEACQRNKVPNSWRVGNYKSMTINGMNYRIDIIGKNHDVYADGTGIAPLTFQLHDCYETKYRMNGNDTNSGGWNKSQMRTLHIPTILSLMPSEVQAALREVNKLTTGGSTSSTIVTTADKLFLLSEIETFGVVSYSKAGEGSQYEYYAEGYSNAKKVAGVDSIYWLRSPKGNDSASFCSVSNGGGGGYYGPSNPAGVSFAFCF